MTTDTAQHTAQANIEKRDQCAQIDNFLSVF